MEESRRAVDVLVVVVDGVRSTVVSCAGPLGRTAARQLVDVGAALFRVAEVDEVVFDLRRATFAGHEAPAAMVTVRSLLHDRPVRLRGPGPDLLEAIQAASADRPFEVLEEAT